MNGYFVGPDANDELWIWRERGDYPVPLLGKRDLRDDPELWEAIVAIVTSGDEKQACRHRYPDGNTCTLADHSAPGLAETHDEVAR